MSLYVDEALMTTVSGMRAISEVRCGDLQSRGNVGAVYWDAARFY